MSWDARDGAALLTLVAVCLAAFHDQLTYWFTGPDTFSLIRSSRITGLGDVVDIFTQPMMSGTDFTRIADFYRPVTQLSFSLDWALWGLDPTGYLATNLLLHATATVLVYVLARRLTGGSRSRALVASILFTLHPVTVESVPAISRRQDALATVFLLGSLLTYLRARTDPDRGRAWLAGSLGLALAAFGSKEIAIVLPGAILVHAWLVDREATGGFFSVERARFSLRRTAPYATVAALFVAWRTAVIGGFGGYPDRADLVSRWVAWELGEYMTALLSPLRYLQVVLELSGPQLALAVSILTATLIGLVLVLYRGRSADLGGDLRRFAATRSGRVAGFCVAWMLGGAVLFASARTFDDWSAYQFLVPLSIVTADLLVGGLVALRRSGSPVGWRPAVLNGRAIAAATILLSASVATTLAYSPAVRGEEAWETNGEVQRAVLRPLATSVGSTPHEITLVRAHNLAWEDRTRTGQLPQVHTVYYFQDFTIEDWLFLRCGEGCDTDVAIESATSLDARPDHVVVQLEPHSNGTADLHLSYRSNGSTSART